MRFGPEPKASRPLFHWQAHWGKSPGKSPGIRWNISIRLDVAAIFHQISLSIPVRLVRRLVWMYCTCLLEQKFANTFLGSSLCFFPSSPWEASPACASAATQRPRCRCPSAASKPSTAAPTAPAAGRMSTTTCRSTTRWLARLVGQTGKKKEAHSFRHNMLISVKCRILNPTVTSHNCSGLFSLCSGPMG